MELKKASHFIQQELEKNLSPSLTYHSVVHTKDVVAAAEKIALSEGISQNEILLVLTAAWYHDSGFMIKRSGHETESCRIASAALPQFGYSQQEIECICTLIMATQLPQRPKDHLAEIICDADLDYLGREDFFSTSHKLYAELHAFNPELTVMEWNRQQVAFLENHHYFTLTSITARRQKKEDHLKKLKSIIIQNPL